MASMHKSSNKDGGIAPLPTADLEMVPPTLSEQSVIPTKADDPYLVTFSEHFDASNPKDWSSRRKWAVTDVLSATGFNRIMVSTIMAPALTDIARELNMSTTAAVMSMSIYLLATAFGPLVIGPLSEVYGRQPVLHASNVWFLVWNIVCGFAKTGNVLIAARFLAGFGASSIYALAGGVLGDVWRDEQRGKSMGVYLLIPLLGAAVGPIIGGFMAGRTTWRWMFWSTSIFQAIMIIVSFTAFRETYAPIILKRKAEKLRRNTGNERYHTMHERLEEKKSVISILSRAFSRPVRLLAFHPIIQITTLICGFSYGMLYIVLSSFAEIWTSHYGFSVELSGLHYIACAAGELVACQLSSVLMDTLHRRMLARKHDTGLDAKYRLLQVFPGIIVAQAGFLIYGWTAQYHVHWAWVDFGVFVYSFGSQVPGMAIQAYVMEMYPEHVSSAMAAMQFGRSLTAFLFPLFTPSLYKALGYGWGNSLVALLGLIVGIPLPLVLWRWGGMLRDKGGESR